MPIHSIHWMAFASSLDDESLICDALAWLSGDEDSVAIEKTNSFHGSAIHIISVNITKRSMARKALSRVGVSVLEAISSDLESRLDDENCIHFRISLDELVCARIALVDESNPRTVKGKLKLRIYPGDKPATVAEKLFGDAIERANRNK